MNDAVESIDAGTYVVAISGGVDSMVLLDLLSKQTHLRLIVAHYNHGIRTDSAEDARMVARVAKKLKLPFELGHGRLGSSASEEAARIKRYEFLDSVARRYKARAVITAHHEDDVLETAVLNTLRGTGRKGLTSLIGTKSIVRPLLKTTKQEILRYAKKHNIEWREDSTNSDDRYRRNYVRKHVLANLPETKRAQLVAALTKQRILNRDLDMLLADIVKQPSLKRVLLVQLTHMERCEVVAAWLRMHGLRGFDRLMIERLSVLSVTLPIGKRADAYSGAYISSGNEEVTLHVTR